MYISTFAAVVIFPPAAIFVTVNAPSVVAPLFINFEVVADPIVAFVMVAFVVPRFVLVELLKLELLANKLVDVLFVPLAFVYAIVVAVAFTNVDEVANRLLIVAVPVATKLEVVALYTTILAANMSVKYPVNVFITVVKNVVVVALAVTVLVKVAF